MGRPGLNRSAVIAAAADLADELGFDAVTISVLARHLGVKIGRASCRERV